MSEYMYHNAEAGWVGSYLHDEVLTKIKGISPHTLMELGCGNGSFAKKMQATLSNCEITAIDSSSSGIELAKNNFHGIKFYDDSVYEDLAKKYGHFDCIVSLEVIEHLYDPRKFVKNVYNLLNEGGGL